MAGDDTDKKDPDPAKGDDKKDDDDLGDAGKSALDKERKARRDAEREKRDLAAKLKEFEDADKSASDKAAENAKDAAEQRARADRLQVALDKGLTSAQAKRLVGSTLEELESDADEILETFGGKPSKGSDDDGDDDGKDDAKRPPSRKPSDDLKGGTDPTQSPTETDPAKLAESVPRL